jgi:hypothetical protein
MGRTTMTRAKRTLAPNEPREPNEDPKDLNADPRPPAANDDSDDNASLFSDADVVEEDKVPDYDEAADDAAPRREERLAGVGGDGT